MKKSIFNLLFRILCIVLWVINPWPFETSKTYYIEKTQMVGGGFDTPQKNAKKSNLGGLKNDPIQQTAKLEPQAPKQSSSSNSNTNSNSNTKPKYRPVPGSNPGGSGNFDFDENLSNSGNSAQVISDPAFWDSIKTLGESEKEEDSSPREVPKPSPPTGKLTNQAIRDNDATTKMISPTEFNDWEGESRTIKSKELKKTVFSKGYDTGVVPDKNLVPCPVQSDSAKFQRERCGLVTDQSVEQMRDKLIELTTSRKDGRVKLKLDMPFYEMEKTIAYIYTNTGDCAFYHEDSGKYWTYGKYKKKIVQNMIANSDWVKLAKPSNSNSEL